MIKGEKADGTKILDIKLRKLFFILNLYIEASYNQNNYKKNSHVNLYNQVKQLTYNADTNFYINEIYNIINHDKSYVKTGIPNIYEAGNPIDFYKALINYLDYNMIKIIRLDIYNNINVENF